MQGYNDQNLVLNVLRVQVITSVYENSNAPTPSDVFLFLSLPYSKSLPLIIDNFE